MVGESSYIFCVWKKKKKGWYIIPVKNAISVKVYMLQGMAIVTEKLVMVPLVPSQSAKIDAS